MKALAIILASLYGSLVSAQTGVQPKTRFVELGTLSGCNAQAINSAVNCEVRCTSSCPSGQDTLGVEDFNLLTLEVFYDYAAGTGISWIFQSCSEGLLATNCTDTTDWFDVQAISTVAGTATMSDYTPTKTVSAADDYFAVSIGLNYKRLRLKGILATGSPTASDKVTIKARLSAVSAM